MEFRSKWILLWLLRLVKDELCSVDGLSNFKITKSLLQSAKVSYTLYQVYLEAENKVKVDQEQKKEGERIEGKRKRRAS